MTAETYNPASNKEKSSDGLILATLCFADASLAYLNHKRKIDLHKTTVGMWAIFNYCLERPKIHDERAALNRLDKAVIFLTSVNDEVDLGTPVENQMRESNDNLVTRLRFVHALRDNTARHRKVLSELVGEKIPQAYENNIELLGGNSEIDSPKAMYAEMALMMVLCISSTNQEFLEGTGIDPKKAYKDRQELIDAMQPRSNRTKRRKQFDRLVALTCVVKMRDDDENTDDKVWSGKSDKPVSVDAVINIAKPALSEINSLIVWFVDRSYTFAYRLKTRGVDNITKYGNAENPSIFIESTCTRSVLRESLIEDGHTQVLVGRRLEEEID